MTIPLTEWQNVTAHLYRDTRWDMDDAKAIACRLEDMNDADTVSYLKARRVNILLNCAARQEVAAEHARIGRYTYEMQHGPNAFAGIPLAPEQS